MRAHARIVLIALLALASVAVAIDARRLVAARDQVADARQRLVETHAAAQEVISLRGQVQRIASSPRPEQDVLAQVNRILADVGLAGGRHLGGLSADAAATVRGADAAGCRRQTLQLTLEDLSPVQIGRFLATWRRAEPLWTPVRIELTHRRAPGADANRFDVSLALSAVYLVES